MSKAFTKEDDDAGEEIAAPRATLPDGATNYMTPGGATRFREELARCQEERARLSAARDDADAAARLRRVEARIREITQSLASAEIVTARDAREVLFGATVRVRDGRGAETEYRIVGVDEADFDRGWVSWMSPIARALLQRKLKERVRFKFPSGEEELEIVGIAYE